MAKEAQSVLLQKVLDNQVLRFVLSAGVGFVVDIAAYYILYDALLKQNKYNIFGYTTDRANIALAVSFFIGVLVNFVITRTLVFTQSVLAAHKQLFRFMAVAVVGFTANLTLLQAFIRYAHLYPPVARPAAALSLFFASFFVHKFFSFNLSLRPDESANPNP